MVKYLDGIDAKWLDWDGKIRVGRRVVLKKEAEEVMRRYLVCPWT